MQSGNKIVYGSVKNKIVSSDLQEERANSDFNIKEGNILYHLDFFCDAEKRYKFAKEMADDPILKNSHLFYEMTREEKF